MSEIIKERFILAYNFGEFKSMVVYPHCFWTMARQYTMVGAYGKGTCCLMATGKQRGKKRRSQGSNIHFRCTPSMS
jgi:hypothetical protein